MPAFVDSLIVLAVVLIIARYIKRGSGLLQRFFIPSSLIAGIGGLLLGPQVLGTISAEVTDIWAQLPQYLISIVFAGLFLGRVIPNRKDMWRLAGPMIAFGNTMAWGQYVIGILLTILFLGPYFGAPALAGSLIEISFAGGHGTAAGLAPTFEKLGWEDGTDIALGLATLSIITAVLTGIIMINIHSRRSSRADQKHIKEQQRHLARSGYNLLTFTQRLNTNPKAVLINALAFAFAIGIGWILLKGLIVIEDVLLQGMTDVRFFAFVPLFPLAMIGGLILQLTLRKFHHQHLIQRHTAQVFSTIALDLLIASAIATVSLHAISHNLAIFITLGFAGILWIIGCFLLLAPRYFKDHWFERGITDYGQAMGMTATGMLMNRLADPSNSLKIKESFAYKQLAFEPFMGGGLVTATAAIVIVEFGSVPALISATIVTIFWVIVGLRLGKKRSSTLSKSSNLG